MKWNDLPQLPSHRFRYENSGRKSGEAPPYSIEENGDLTAWFSPYTPIGWIRNPPFKTDYPAIGIMFEDQDFNQIWWHFLDPEYEPEELPEGFIINELPDCGM